MAIVTVIQVISTVESPLVNKRHHLVLPKSFLLLEALKVPLPHLVNHYKFYIFVPMMPLIEMFSYFTDAVFKLVSVAIMTSSHLLPASTDILLAASRFFTLDEVNDPRTTTSQLVSDVICSATFLTCKRFCCLYDRTCDTFFPVTFTATFFWWWLAFPWKWKRSKS